MVILSVAINNYFIRHDFNRGLMTKAKTWKGVG
jgi:hypothetical protein